MSTEIVPPELEAGAKEGEIEAASPPVFTERQGGLHLDRATLLRFVPLLILILFIWIFGRTQEDNRLWIDLGVEAMYVAALALGVNILLGYTGLLSLGHAGFVFAGGLAGAVWTVEWGLSPWFGIPISFAAGAVLGAVLALMCCHLKGFYLTVVTLAFGLILGPLAVQYPGVLGGFTGKTVTKQLNVSNFMGAGDRQTLGLFYLSAVLLLVTLYLCWNLVRTRWGRAYMAIRESEIAARSSGVNTYWYKVSSFSLSAGIVAAAGFIAAERFTHVSAANSQGIVADSFRYVIMIALGGMGTLAGPILGAFGLTFGFGITWVQDTFTQYQALLFGGLGLFGVATAPEGTMGNLRKGVRNYQLKQAQRGVVRRAKPITDVPAELKQPKPRSANLADASADGSATANEVVLEVSGLVKRFGGLTALDNIDLVVRRNTIHAVIGPNGSGKTTLINVVTGFYDATQGRISFVGQDITNLKSHQLNRLGLSRTFQNLQIWRRMSVLENVMVGAHSRSNVGLSRSVLGTYGSRVAERKIRQKAWGLLHFVGLADKAHEPAGSLPFADQRRLEIARALAGDPDLLLLDEPAAGMHPSEIRELVSLVREIRDTGVTVLLIEHHMDLVMGLSDTISVLDYGSKIAEGPPDVVRNDQRVIEAYLGTESVV